jgi:hypothetical protein
MATESFVKEPLRLELSEDGEAICVVWSGKSMAREPGPFVLPVLARAIELGERGARRVVIDFRPLSYLNSSTLSPLVRVLEQARRGSSRVTVRFDPAQKWQELAFTALRLFATADGRIEIRGG